MNRIILIGNGFDLAHGLKTSYRDFMDWFWKKQLLTLPTEVAKWTYQSPRFIYQNEFIRVEKQNFLFDFENKYASDDEVYEKIKNAKDHFDIDAFKNSISYTNKFLEIIDKNLKIQNWVDIEELYFQQLIVCKNHFIQKKDECDYYSIENLNKNFDAIKHELENYLDIHVKHEMDGIRQKALLRQKIHDIIWGIDQTTKCFPKEILFLNFNFTNTADLYVAKKNAEAFVSKRNETGGDIIDEDKNIVIHIHGQINDDYNKLIFGYGDEKSKESEEIENLNNNAFLENVKSIKYTETSNYDLLEEFIKKNDYEIIILGHSCGNSDRTLLKMLFEQDHCQNIRCYLYKNCNGKDNFQELSRNIYRNFDDKTKYRHKLEKYNKENIIPQHDDETRHIDDLNMIPVPAGKYKIIGKENATEETIEKFYMGKYPVTQKQYESIMGCNPSHFKGEDLPVEFVTFYDSVFFCNELSKKYKLNKYYDIKGIERHGNNIMKASVEENKDASGFRLPTETEWEYAATSAGKYKNKDDYARNEKTNHLDDLGWYSDNSDHRTHPIGKKQPNGLGLYDMSGNVCEWCEDWEDWYNNNLFGCVLRGGSWYSDAKDCSVSNCDPFMPDFSESYIGFRLALPQ